MLECAEEVIEGDRTLKVEGSGSAEVAPQISASLFKVVKVGRAASRSQADTVKIKECRIVYRRAGLETRASRCCGVDADLVRGSQRRRKAETHRNAGTESQTRGGAPTKR